MPTGAWAFLGATVGLATHTLTFEQMFAAADNTVVWLIVVSFFLAKVCPPAQESYEHVTLHVISAVQPFKVELLLSVQSASDWMMCNLCNHPCLTVSVVETVYSVTSVCFVFVPQGFEKTGLGQRIANKLLTLCGSNTLGLALGLAAADMLISTAMPSTTSRAAGIFMPVIASVSKEYGSLPGGVRCCSYLWPACMALACHCLHDLVRQHPAGQLPLTRSLLKCLPAVLCL